MSELFALVDCNNFFVSCERVFQPRFDGRPVVVLSSNDGCVVARSNEVKALGVKMGTPWFRIRDLARQYGIIGLSSNFTLYGNMSDRVVEILRTFSTEVEVYSIDESFVGIHGLGRQWKSPVLMGQAMRQRILQWTGLPVCVGIASSKTLAKLANHVAKVQPPFEGVCDFSAMTECELEQLIDPIDICEVWGIGRRSAEHLQRSGIFTVRDLRRAAASEACARFGVVMRRIISELRGLSCLKLDDVDTPHQQIITSRSFGSPVTTADGLRQAISTFVARAGERLRGQETLCAAVHTFIQTSRFVAPCYAKGTTVALADPSDDTRVLTKAALTGLQRIFRGGCQYKKAGVVLMDLSPVRCHQSSLLADKPALARSERVMAAMDAINTLYGRDTLYLGAAGTRAGWNTRADNRTRCYTTNWHELPQVCAGHGTPRVPSQDIV